LKDVKTKERLAIWQNWGCLKTIISFSDEYQGDPAKFFEELGSGSPDSIQESSPGRLGRFIYLIVWGCQILGNHMLHVKIDFFVLFLL
jgi:hypothetical protein